MSTFSFATEIIPFTDSSIQQSECGSFFPIKKFSDIILRIIAELNNQRDYINNALSCKMMFVLSTFPLGKCLFPSDEPRNWLQLLKDWYPNRSRNFNNLFLSEIVRYMPNFENFEMNTLSLPSSSYVAPTVQFLSMDLPKDSPEAYLQNGLIRKLMRNKYLDSVVKQIKNIENQNKPNYYSFYHACSLSAFIFTQFTGILIEVANTCGKKFTENNLNTINKISWFRFPQSKDDEKYVTVSDFKDHFSLEEGSADQNDHEPKIQKQLLSIVPFLFSSLTDPGECSWNLFEDNRSVNPLTKEKYFNLLCDHFQLLPNSSDREKFLELFITLHGQFCFLAHEKLKIIHKALQMRDSGNVDPRGVICQILVPHRIASKVVYLSKPYGFIDHSQDEFSFEELMQKISVNPSEHAKLQFRILAHHIGNVNSGIVVNNYGYGNFFSSAEAVEFRKEIHKFFLNMLITTTTS